MFSAITMQMSMTRIMPVLLGLATLTVTARLMVSRSVLTGENEEANIPVSDTNERQS